jgi:TatA/E family protein of Tat protein translocase
MDMVCAPLAFIDGLGGPEMMLVFVIILVLFGGQKLPEFARGLGKTMREFKKAASGVEEEFKRALDEDERKKTADSNPIHATTPALNAPADGSDPYDPHAYEHQDDHYSEAGPNSPNYDHPADPDPALAGGTALAAETSPEAAPLPVAETSPESEKSPEELPAEEKKKPAEPASDQPKP